MTKKRRLTTVLGELDAEEFDAMPTKKRERADPTIYTPPKTATCPQCRVTILTLPGNRFVKHEGPCGLPCLGSGVAPGVSQFHDKQCQRPTCVLRVPLVGYPRAKRNKPT